MKKIAIYGAGGHGKVIADIAQRCGYLLIDFFDSSKKSGTVASWNIKGDFKNFNEVFEYYDEVIIAIGNNNDRLAKILEVRRWGAQLATLIDPQAHVSEGSKVEAGTVVMPGAIINIGSEIGMGCIINTGATIDHDCKISEGAHISPGVNLAGNVKVGKRSWVGIGSSVIQNITIGDDVTVGAGSVVIRDIPANKKVAGVPAKEIG